MKALKDERFFNLFREFVDEYLPKQRRCRPNTVRAYQNSLDSLIDYIKEKNNIRLGPIRQLKKTGYFNQIIMQAK